MTVETATISFVASLSLWCVSLTHNIHLPSFDNVKSAYLIPAGISDGSVIGEILSAQILYISWSSQLVKKTISFLTTKDPPPYSWTAFLELKFFGIISVVVPSWLCLIITDLPDSEGLPSKK